MQPTTNNQSSFNPLTIIAPGNGSIKGPTGDPDDGSGTVPVSSWRSLKSLEKANLHHNLSHGLYKSSISSIPSSVPGPLTLLNNRAVNGKSKRLIDIKQDFNSFRQLKLAAFFANYIYCNDDKELGANVPSGRLKVDINMEVFTKTLIINFKGPELTKDQWAARSTQLITYEVEGFKSNSLIRVDKDWQIDFLAIRKSLFTRIQSLLIGYQSLNVQLISFVGHAIGGAYATIAGLTWRIQSFLMSDIGVSPQMNLSALKVSTTTFGAPRVGNVVFARLVNKLLKVQRITYFNDHVPHFPPPGVKNDLLEHFETEYWILPGSCECLTEKNNEEDSFYECRGFDYGSQSWKYHELRAELEFPYGVMSGENEECNAGQSINNVHGNFIHKEPYFGPELPVTNYLASCVLVMGKVAYLLAYHKWAVIVQFNASTTTLWVKYL
ncbi:hypothetical protein G9A89_008861 [Geosiphon pyriformis]|nr:hypothetical protein G9A89_008861 [Geosiphon pyriformis]